LIFAGFTGPVVSILDGDTIEVLHNAHPERIRLSGIDCPEKSQAFGTRARQALSALVFGKDVTLDTHGQDKYRRTLADVFLRDGTNVNHALVKDGWCWWYRKYAPGDAELEKLEKDARDTRRGLWADRQPVPPWVYRKAKRGQSRGLSDLVPLDADTDERRCPLLGALEQDSESWISALRYPVIGNDAR
jgi:micrococcal nuclease